MALLDRVPPWVLRPLPANAALDESLHARLDELATHLPTTLPQIQEELDAIQSFREYEAAANRAAAHVWLVLDQFFASRAPGDHFALLRFAAKHVSPEAQARIYRRLVRAPAHYVRSAARALVKNADLREVALPLKADRDWGPEGWFHGTLNGPLLRHKQGASVQAEHGVPPLANVGQLRELLDVRSTRQLGYFLLASDANNGPYTTFSIPKRDGTSRTICAPGPQLRYTQRQVLAKILAQVPAHDAAHGFVPGRSTVTNALPHLGAEVIVKFDLTDFFPTIHYYRVVGLFTSLGYYVGNARFSGHDDSTHVAPTLARLCCYVSNPKQWGSGVAPQGAPTSPAISNLVCRRLDARLDGLAKRNKGTYTRYADDLTFSFKKAPPALGRFRWWVDQVCHQEGFLVNRRKFHVVRRSQRQLVTGLVVNDELNVPREARRRFRAVLHNCRVHGMESQARGRPRFKEYLRGFASYVHMVHPEEGAELLRQVTELLGPEEGEQGGEP